MIANAPGTVNDIVDEQYRALAFSIWSIGPMSGPVTGPIAGGFAAQYLGWRWTGDDLIRTRVDHVLVGEGNLRSGTITEKSRQNTGRDGR